MNTDQFLPGREPEVHFDHRERPRIVAGDFSDEHSEIAYSLACFFSWLSGKGFSRGAWLIQHYGTPRRLRRLAYRAQVGRKERKYRCRFCRARGFRGKHYTNCKVQIPRAIASFMQWVKGDGDTRSEASNAPDSNPTCQEEGPAIHHE